MLVTANEEGKDKSISIFAAVRCINLKITEICSSDMPITTITIKELSFISQSFFLFSLCLMSKRILREFLKI